MMWDPAAAQELLDALFAKAAELDEWDRQSVQEDERRELKRCDTPVDFMGLNNQTCRWPLFEGYEPFYEKLFCGARTSSGSHYCAAHAASSVRFSQRQKSRAGICSKLSPQNRHA
jgi:hypothetical protein